MSYVRRSLRRSSVYLFGAKTANTIGGAKTGGLTSPRRRPKMADRCPVIHGVAGAGRDSKPWVFEGDGIMALAHFFDSSLTSGLSMLSAAVIFCCLGMTQSASAQESDAPTAQSRRLGVLIFPGFELLDAYGPLEMWGNLRGKIEIVMVATEAGPVASAQGPKTVADFSLADCPKLDLILVPGGVGAIQMSGNAEALDWLRQRSAEAEITMSVCNGASILAASGLLDGRRATTNKAYWGLATAPGPNVDWVKQARWVDAGDIVTSSGVSAGIDMSLHVIERLFGENTATRLADMTEYEWHRDPTWDPFAKMHGLVDTE